MAGMPIIRMPARAVYQPVTPQHPQQPAKVHHLFLDRGSGGP